MERTVKKHCNRCNKDISEITYILHEKFCEYLSLEEFKYCHLCDSYLELNEFDDHMYSHNFSDELNGNLEEYLQSKESFDIEKNYEFIDKDSLLKDIEEQEIFEKKFAKIKSVSKKTSNIFTKKIIPYLFYSDNVWKMPRSLVILAGIFIDRTLLVNFCLIELLDFWLGKRTMNQEIDDVLLELIPERKVDDLNELPEDKKSCIICLSDYEVGDSIMTLSCTHSFHSNCIKEWLKDHNHCPICKHEIKKENYEI